MRQKKKKGGGKLFVLVCILAFICFFVLGIVSKFWIKPSWAKKYEAEMTPETEHCIRISLTGIRRSRSLTSICLRTAQKIIMVLWCIFMPGDLRREINPTTGKCCHGFVPRDMWRRGSTIRSGRKNIRMRAFIHSRWKKRGCAESGRSSGRYGYPVSEMAAAGGSAGHTLAMIYAYRDADASPVPVKLLFGAVGPSGFYAEDWDIYGLDRDTEEAREAAAGLFGVMGGTELTPEMIEDGSYIEKMKPVSAVMWVDEDTVPSVVAYGNYDKVQPFKGSLRLRKAYRKIMWTISILNAPIRDTGFRMTIKSIRNIWRLSRRIWTNIFRSGLLLRQKRKRRRFPDKLLRRHTVFFLEFPIKVRQIGKSARHGYVEYGAAALR